MRVETIKQYTSKLPAHDPHPYRTGAWSPNTVEVDAHDLEVIAGEIPADLEGVYLRNTENPLFDAITGRYHPFDGDGMIHAIRFEGGKADYRNRFVKTAGLLAELEADGPLWAGILESPALSQRDGWGARTRMKDASSTDVIVHNGVALTTFYQCGDAYRLDPETLAPRGVASLHHPSFTKGATISAHPKVDEATGELLFFNYSTEAPYCHVGIADARGALVRAIPVELPGPRLPHDMAFTERFAIINDFPVFWDPAKLAQNVYRARYYPDLGSRFGLVPRSGEGPVRWFTASPTYVLHFSNAYEEGHEVVLEGYFQGAPVPERTADDTPITMFMKSLDMHAMKTRRHRWRFNLETGATREEAVDDECSEFPTIHAGYAGRKHRFVYAATGEPGLFLFNGLTRTDVETGAKSTYRFPKGVFGSEAPFCPRKGATSEDDGYLVTFTIDAANDASECQIFDARDLERGPVARVRLPMRISSGTHATWTPLPGR
ncbi:carotenoid oxygenase family protein [Chondromyces apiculatus]|uniref:Lignostilbene-alpha,beta-dioxygenase n=1 Tax=Chondromyces apiculatus DSM 436 TaxID=1192034 RepID=A0A017T8E6_9BACT|nr:carotenoid oxygenase family protein [Chondromyces apiculatus]EYF05050.1 Lignostilbene-alpha,beta-dioxygenase [Chondromyces apiculatus DSM 436]